MRCSVILSTCDAGFCKVDKRIFIDNRLSAHSKLILAYLSGKYRVEKDPDYRRPNWYPRKDELMRTLGLGRNTIEKALANLIACGYLKREKEGINWKCVIDFTRCEDEDATEPLKPLKNADTPAVGESGYDTPAVGASMPPTANTNDTPAVGASYKERSKKEKKEERMNDRNAFFKSKKQGTSLSGDMPKALADRIEKQKMKNLKPLFEGTSLSGDMPKALADSKIKELANMLCRYWKDGHRQIVNERSAEKAIIAILKDFPDVTLGGDRDLIAWVNWLIENHGVRSKFPPSIRNPKELQEKIGILETQHNADMGILSVIKIEKMQQTNGGYAGMSAAAALDTERLIEQAQRRRIAKGLPAVQTMPEDEEMEEM